MKRSPLLHAELSHVIASLGHGDMLVLGDAGLPIPDGPRRIDLAVARGVPLLNDVLQAVLSEMQVEGIVVADEALGGDTKKLPDWYPQSLGIEPQTVSHEEFKRRTAKARAMVRTGECTPYANIILVAGVKF
ncbi:MULTISPECIES: D-ribose pyranase [unclassified Variovorax]|uniref:D-ribose pyranase n=1 Tax=unclassified Variovorax TaxID=663243 RepID=UPI000F7D5D62|nr:MULTISPECIES: D-ribose pyranase [unclassified Variovorax]RSZ41194.1 D-ribose pyranase [Variovorax sp. 553]RSZ41898.1 D-ribose pyranase [Variovorax sp. 679]